MANVTLKLSLGGFAVEVTGPPAYADKKLEDLVGRYLSSSVKSQPESPMSRPSDVSGGKKMSAAEFLKKSGHSNQTDRAILLGYYIEREGAPNFSTKEIGDLGKQTKHPFTNVSDSVARLVARGLMMSAGEKDGQRGYALTASGEEYVEAMIAKP